MHPLPHTYAVDAACDSSSSPLLSTAGAPRLASAAPREFDGPGDQWSPEALLMGALASCFVLTFKAVARASKLEWTRLECTVEGVLERVDGVMRFTHVVTKAKLMAPRTSHAELRSRALEKAEAGCLVSNSLSARRELRIELIDV